MAATATLSTSLPVTDSTQSTQIARGSIALTGNYGGGATNGDTLNLALYGVQSNYPPLEVRIFEEPAAGSSATGFSTAIRREPILPTGCCKYLERLGPEQPRLRFCNIPKELLIVQGS